MGFTSLAHADVPRADVRPAEGVTFPDGLQSKLERAVGEIDNAPQSELEARRRARSAQELAVAILNTEGYYRPVVTTAVEENRAIVLVDPGPQFVIREQKLVWTDGVPRDVATVPSASTAAIQATPDAAGGRQSVAPEDSSLDTDDDGEVRIPEGMAEASGDIPYVRLGAAPVHPEIDIVAKTRDAVKLEDGTPARLEPVLAAEARGVVVLKNNGFAYAAADPRLLEIEDVSLSRTTGERATLDTPDADIVVDHQMRPEFHLDPGPLVRLERNIRGDIISRRRPGDRANENARVPTRTRKEFVERLIPWKDGDIYSPEALAEMERRLVDTGVYASVDVSLPNGNSPEVRTATEVTVPISVSLVDKSRDQIDARATYATDDGFSAGVYRNRLNRSGRAETLTYGGHWGSIDSRLGAEYSLPHFRRVNRTLRLSGWLVNEDTDAYQRQAVTFGADLNQRWGPNSWFSYGIGLDAGRYQELRYDPIDEHAIAMDRNLAILTLRTSALLDRSDDLLDPTEGWRVSGSLQPTIVAGEDNVYFLRGHAEGSAYYPIGSARSTILAGRLKLGSIVGGNELNVPSDRLFYSGGGGSVRGYSYQSINPRLPDNTPRGGVSLFETSLEVRHNIGESWQAVGFIDGGATGPDEAPNLGNMRYGAGVGVRYKLPFGPVRADVAFPLNKREGDSSFQLYISIGQSF
ncbi:autotransporter assembly complex protein TamA [Brevundimonas pishanensis]|uniref:autotransporter assembly complex protein TamA n=1 Tax=Brevundimonas pishanensis TaxID=2896315 RepID=UPI001FA7B35B|nr:BamA/TamA family outer membrane protein [Brevundimonas pishanensis]